MLATLATLSSACDREAEAARDVSTDRAHAVRFASADCAEIVVPQGFALGWKRFNHRMSKWGISLGGESCEAAELEVTHVGGLFSKSPVLDDTPWVRLNYQRAKTGGGIAAARVSLQDIVGPAGRTRGTARFSIADLGLEGYSHYVAFIEGIRFDTGVPQSDDYPLLYNPKRGYTTRGIGASVDVGVDGDELVLDYELIFETGRTPERIFMNSALPYARVGTGMEVLILAADSVPVTRGSVSYEMEHERPTPFVDPRLPSADEKLQAVAVSGEPHAPRGLWGIQRFRFALDFDSDCETDDDCSVGECNAEKKCDVGIGRLGEYIREFSVGVSLADFDEATGKARFLVDGYASNASSLLAFYPLRYEFQGGFAWVQTGDVHAPRGIETTFETGTARFALE